MGESRYSRWEMVVRDPSPEGVLNGLAEASVDVRGAQPLDAVTLYLEVPYGQMKRARCVLEGRGSELQLCRPHGLVPALRRLGRRYGLLGALGVCALLLCVSNLFVWRIAVTGNEAVPTGAVLRAMENAGAGIGSFWPAFDSEELKNALLLQLEEVHWVAVNYRSGAVEVVLREKRPVPVVVDNDEPVHIVATQTGILDVFSVKQGQPCVGEGDTVEKGQKLISGTVVSPIGTTRGVHALGSAQARTWRTISARIPLEEQIQGEITRKKLKISLILGRNRVKFYRNSSIFGDTCDTITMDYHLCMEGVFSLPVRLVVQQCLYRETAQRETDVSAAQAQGKEGLRTYLQQILKAEDEIVTTDFAAKGGKGVVTVTVMAECMEEIGEELPVTQEELRQIQSDNRLREEATND